MSNWLTTTWGKFGALVLLAGIVIGMVVTFWGCSHVASDLATRQQAIQDCILSGGHPRLGPANTVLCN